MVQAYRYGFDIQPQQLAVRIWMRLKGEAKDVVEHLELDELATEGGYDKLFAVLDKAFEQHEVEKLEESIDGFWHYRRSFGMDMETYISGFRTAKRRMEREDPDTKLSDKAYSVRLLKRAGLTVEEKRQVLAATGAVYDTVKIEGALLQMFRDAARTDKQRVGAIRQQKLNLGPIGGPDGARINLNPSFKGGGKKGFGKKGFGKGGKGFGRLRPSAFVADLDPSQHDEEFFDEDEPEYVDDGLDEDPEEAFAADLLDDVDEQVFWEYETQEWDIGEHIDPAGEEADAMAAFMTAKKRLQAARATGQRGSVSGKGRGGKGTGGSDIAARKAKSRCSDCGGMGHWHGDPECPKVKSGAVPQRQRPAGSSTSSASGVHYVMEEGPVVGGRKTAYQVAPTAVINIDVPVPAPAAPAAPAGAPGVPAVPPPPVVVVDGCSHQHTRKGGNQHCKYKKCLDCGERLAIRYKSPIDPRNNDPDGEFVGMAEVVREAYDVDRRWDETRPDTVVTMDSRGIWDSGCRRTVAGDRWLKLYVQEVTARGYRVEWEPEKVSFKFGNQGMLQSEKCYLLPVAFYGVLCILRVSEVPGNCPLLISEESMRDLGVTLHFKEKLIDVGELNLYACPLEYHESGHPVVTLMPEQLWVSGNDQPLLTCESTYTDYAGKATEEASIEEVYDQNWLFEANTITVKKGVRRRLVQLTALGAGDMCTDAQGVSRAADCVPHEIATAAVAQGMSRADAAGAYDACLGARKIAAVVQGMSRTDAASHATAAVTQGMSRVDAAGACGSCSCACDCANTNHVVPSRRRWKVLEIFSWTMMISSIAAGMNWDVLEPIDYVSGWDLYQKADRTRALNYLDREAPDLVVLAWPCTCWSIMQNSHIRRPGYMDELQRRRQRDMVFLQFTLNVVNRQLARGKHVLLENPLSSRAWQTDIGKQLIRMLYPARTHLCAYGLQCPQTGGFIRKPTLLLTSSPVASERLARRCPGNHVHRAIAGTTYVNGKSQSISEFAGGYTEKFAKCVMQAFTDTLLQERGEMLGTYPITAAQIDNYRRKALLDDVPLSIKRNFKQSHPTHPGIVEDTMARAVRMRESLDDVPESIKRKIRRKELLDDVPVSIRRALGMKRVERRREEENDACDIRGGKMQKHTPAHDGNDDVEQIPVPEQYGQDKNYSNGDEEQVPVPRRVPRRLTFKQPRPEPYSHPKQYRQNQQYRDDVEQVPVPNEYRQDETYPNGDDVEYIPVPEESHQEQDVHDDDWEEIPVEYKHEEEREYDPEGRENTEEVQVIPRGPVRRRLRGKQSRPEPYYLPTNPTEQNDEDEVIPVPPVVPDDQYGENEDLPEEEENVPVMDPMEIERLWQQNLQYDPDRAEYDNFLDGESVLEHERPDLLENAGHEPDPCPDIDPTIKAAVRRAHRNLGHPSRDSFVRMLRLGGAAPDAITYARAWQCPVCLRCQPPLQQLPASRHTAENFNDVVGVDLLLLHDSENEPYTVLSIVDFASRYHNAVLVHDKKPATVARAFARFWLRWAGSPRKVIHDQGGEFQGSFARLMDKLNTGSYVTGSEAGWQNGMVERHGGILKVIFRHIIEDVPVCGEDEVEMALIAATLAKNQLASVHGFSPIQHVLGQDVRLPASLLDGPDDIASHSWAMSSGPFQKRLAMREAARCAWVRLDNSSRLRRAVVARTRRRPGPWMPGEQVYFWRRAGKSGKAELKGRRRRDPDRWVGPAVVLATVGNSIVWISYRGNLLKVASEHLREATAQENMATKFVMDEMAVMNEALRPSRGQSSFIDLTEQGGSPWNFDLFAESQRAPQPERVPPEPDGEPSGVPTPEISRPASPGVEQPRDDGAAGPEVDPVNVPVPDSPISDRAPGMDVDPHSVPTVNELRAKNIVAGRGTRELDPRYFDENERKAFEEADRKQYQTWLDKGAITVIPASKVSEVAKDRILPGRARVVRTNKAQPGHGVEARSRIVVPGHLDQDLGTFRNDAPTAPQLSMHVLLSVAATFKWKLSAFDVEAAFLNGVPLERELYVRPPPDMVGVNLGDLWKLEKAVFGLTEAPRYWWLRIRKDLIETGWYEVPFLPATFVLYDGNKMTGLLILHVDDGLTCGDGPRYRKAIADLKKRAPLDKWRDTVFEFTGRRIKQNRDFTVEVDQAEYWEKVSGIALNKQRKSQDNAPVTEEEFVALRSLVGKLSWPARESIPGIAFEVSRLQQCMGADTDGRRITTVEHLKMANATLKKAQRYVKHGMTLYFPAVNADDLCVLTMTDASFSNMPRYGSQAGNISMVCSSDIESDWSNTAVLEWTSTRIKRVVKSTLAAEAAALSVAQDRNEFARVAVACMFGKLRVDGRFDWYDALNAVKGFIVVDARSLYDYLVKEGGGLPQEKRIALDLVAVREGLTRPCDKLFWMPTRWQLADSFTKEMRQHEALDMLLRYHGFALKQDILESKAASLPTG